MRVEALPVNSAVMNCLANDVGYSGGRCRELAQLSIHFKVNDVRISEDVQLVVGHMCMKWLVRNASKLDCVDSR